MLGISEIKFRVAVVGLRVCVILLRDKLAQKKNADVKFTEVSGATPRKIRCYFHLVKHVLNSLLNRLIKYYFIEPLMRLFFLGKVRCLYALCICGYSENNACTVNSSDTLLSN